MAFCLVCAQIDASVPTPLPVRMYEFIGTCLTGCMGASMRVLAAKSNKGPALGGWVRRWIRALCVRDSAFRCPRVSLSRCLGVCAPTWPTAWVLRASLSPRASLASVARSAVSLSHSRASACLPLPRRLPNEAPGALQRRSDTALETQRR